jgi:CheY-like chemotaxis protein
LGYKVLVAADGKEALRLVQETGAVDLLITDVVMPEMNGRQLAGELRQRCPQLKVLFISGYTANAIVHQGALDPGVAFLQKPFLTYTLARKVREVLDAPAP